MMYSGELRNELILPFLKEEYMDYTRKLELHYSIECHFFVLLRYEKCLY